MHGQTFSLPQRPPPCAILPPMKRRLSIIIPLAAALLVAGTVWLLIWWQITRTSDVLRNRMAGTAGGSDAAFMMPGNVEVSGDQVLIHLRQGDLQALQGDWGAAEKEYEASVAAGGGIPALRKLAQSQMQRRNTDGVKATINRLKREGAKEEDMLLLESLLQLRLGELAGAQKVLMEAVDSPQKHYGLALLAIVQSDHVAARNELAQVQAGWDPSLRSYARTLQAAYDESALFPQTKPIHLTTLLSRALAQTQECELALPLLAQVVKEQDDYRDAWIVQGYCQLISERFPDALASFEKAYNIDPEKPEVQYFLGRTYSALDEHDNAVTFLNYALQNGFEPRKEVRMRLAAEALAVNKNDLAFEQLDLLARESDVELPTVEKLIAVSIALGKKTEAEGYAVAATQRWPDSAKAFELLGWTQAENGKKDEAKASLEKALEIDPTLQSAKERLGKL